MIEFKDFVPEMKDKGGLFRQPGMEELAEALEKANEWIAANNVDIVNVETVALPNIHNPGEEGSTDTRLYDTGNMTTWHQFIRVWYRKP